MMEDADSKQQLDEAQVIVTELESKHAYTKLQKNITVFKLIGTTNYLGVNETINLTRREIMKSPANSWHALLLRIYLADVFLHLEAV
jgi:hypothetical protein